MKTLISITTGLTLPLWFTGCGHGHDHNHLHDGNSSHTEKKPLSEVKLTETAFRQLRLLVEPVRQHTLEPVFVVPARVAFNEEATAHVGTLVRGQVSAMRVHLGQTVTKGTPLFDIVSPELGQAQNTFLQALDAEAAAEAAIALAENNASVAKAAAEMKATATQLALAKKSAFVKKAEADIKFAEALLTLAENSAAVKQVEADIKSAEALLALAENSAAVKQAEADIKSAEALLALAENSSAVNKAQVDLITAEALLTFAENSTVVKQAEADIKSAEALLTFTENSAVINKAQANLKSTAAAVTLANNNAKVAKAQSQINAALQAQTRAREFHESGLELAKSGAIAKTELKRRESVMLIADAEVKTAEAALEQAKAELTRDKQSATATEQAATAMLNQAKAELTRDKQSATATEQAATAMLTQAKAKQVRDITTAKATEQVATTMLAQAQVQQVRDITAAKAKLAADKAALTAAMAKKEQDIAVAKAKLAADEAALTAAMAKKEQDIESAKAKLAADEAALTAAMAKKEQGIESAKAKLTAASAALQAEKAEKAKDLGKASSALNAARATVATARNQLELYGMDVGKISALQKDRKLAPHHTVLAPCNGTVVEREVTLGENASPDQPHLLILADLTKVWVLIDVPPAQAGLIHKGQPLDLLNPDTGQAIKLKETGSENPITFKLDFISPVVAAETRTIQARVEVANHGGMLRPGQFLTASLHTGDGPVEKLAVPAEAVQSVDGRHIVFVQVKGKKFTYKQQVVSVGQRVNDWIHITSGLKEGDTIVVKGSFILKAEFGKAGAGHDHSH